MSTDTRATAHPRPALSTRDRVGLAVAGVFGVLDVVTQLVTGPTAADEVGPPTSVLVIDAVLGVVTIVAVVWTWRSRSRVGARVVAGSRVLSMITALPAFFVPGAPAPLVAVVGAHVVATVVVGLVLSRPTAGQQPAAGPGGRGSR